MGSCSVSHFKVYRRLYALAVRTRLQCSAFSFLQHFSPPARTRRSTHHTLPDRKLRPNKAALTFALKSAKAASGHRNVAKCANVAFYPCRNGSLARRRLVRPTGRAFEAPGFSYPERKL